MQPFRPFTALLATAVAAVVVPVLTLAPSAGASAGPAAADPIATETTITGPADYADKMTPLDVAITAGGGSPVVNAAVVVQRRVDGTWRPAQAEPVVTDATGHARVPVRLKRDASDNVFRASYAGDVALNYAPSESGPVRISLKRRGSRIGLGGPHQVVDEKTVTLKVLWRTASGIPIPGKVNLYRRSNGTWIRHTSGRTGADGRTSFRLRPRSDSRWQVRGLRQDWVNSDHSAGHGINNLPPGDPVRLPKGAPRPRVSLPKQPHAVGPGPNAAISRIPDGVWSQMTGITWHRGCPVGRSGLRYLKINYWDYQGYRRRGEMVVNAGAVGQVSRALADMYRAKLPIRAMYRVDRFGYSSRVRGGDDHRSMAAGNTSGFNCRDVVNRPGVRSPHSYGRAIDINTWENPYRSATGLVPNSWWMSRSHPRVAWRSSRHAVVRIMRRHNIRWTYGNGDTQHFDAATSSGRVVMAPGCFLPAAVACD